MDLKQTYGKRYRVTMDDSYAHETDTESRREKWRYYEIKGRYGTIYQYSHDCLACWITSSKVGSRLLRELDAAEIIQGNPDEWDEITFKFKNSEIQPFLDAIAPRKRRVLSPAQIEASKKRLAAYHFKPGSNATQRTKTGV